MTVRLAGAPEAWSEFNPRLYRVELQLQANCGSHAVCRFRRQHASASATISRDGRRLLVNGRPTFIRGNLECGLFPLTGYPPCDVEAWRRIFRIYKQYGLNQARFHTWCPPEAAFQAADELGIYLQVEVIWIDYWMSAPNPRKDMDTPGYPQGVGRNDRSIDRFVRAEMRRILDRYGNHPSFAFLVIGNELGTSNFEVMGRWIKEEKERDPRRLYAASTARAITPADDFSDTHLIPGLGPQAGMTVNRLGVPHTDWDYESACGRAPVPIIAHEMGQMPVYPCWDEIAKYTRRAAGADTSKAFREQARRNGIEAQSRELQQASGASQRIIYKNEMEAHLRTPSCSGVSWLSMQDYTGQGEALVGWLDAFYDSKGIVTPAQFRRYSNATVPLARFAKYCWTSGEQFRATAQVAHWGPQPLRGARSSAWQVSAHAHGDTNARPGRVPAGRSGRGLRDHARPDRSRPEADRQGRAAEPGNCRPRHRSSPTTGTCGSSRGDRRLRRPTDVVVCDRLDAALRALSQGRRVLLLAHRLGERSNRRYAAWGPVFWSATFLPGQQADTLGALVENRHARPGRLSHRGAPRLAVARRLCGRRAASCSTTMPADYRPIVQPVSDYHCQSQAGHDLRVPHEGRRPPAGLRLQHRRQSGRPPRGAATAPEPVGLRRRPGLRARQEVSAEYLAKLLPDSQK